MPRLRLLLLEDSLPDAELVQELLDEGLAGCEVVVARSLADGLAVLAEQDVDVALVDLSLPDAQGLEVVQPLLDARPDLPLLVMSGTSGDARAEQALTRGAQDALLKGDLTPALLGRAVRYAVTRAHADRELLRTRAWAQDVLDSIEAPTCTLDVTGTIVAVNAAWRRFGADNGGSLEASGVGWNYLEVCERAAGPGDVPLSRLAGELRELLRRGGGRVEMQYPCHTPTTQRWFTLRATPLAGGEGAVVTHVDVTELRTARDELRSAVLRDPLTGLPNRRHLFSELTRRLALGNSGPSVALLFLDLDGFKQVNETYGHTTGDALLVRVAAELTGVLRADDVVVRHAGDEFVVVASVLDPDEATALADRVQAALCQTLHIDGHELTVSTSQGLVVAPAGSPDAAGDLVAAADAAMHEAKARGRGRVQVFSEDLRRRAEARLQVQRELQRALRRDELVLHYQPIVSTRTGRVEGVEALVRWEHPDRGLLSPADFLDVAETSGLIVPLGDDVLLRACVQARAWHDAGHALRLSVNLSARQLDDRHTVAAVQTALEKSGLAPGALLLEVTETSMIDDTDSALQALSAIKALGVRVAVDDFGTGYSSLAYLKRYPVDVIKVDRSFVRDMVGSSEDQAIVSSLITLARQLDLGVVAEGVETVEQRRLLQGMGCDLLQGYLFARPVGADELLALLEGPPFDVLPEVPAPRAGRQELLPLEPQVADRLRELGTSGASLHTIAAALNADHLPNPRGLRWHPRSVAAYLPVVSVDDGAAVGKRSR